MTRPPQHSREHLLDLLTEAFRCDGYDSTSMASLAKRCGLAKAALYHHFPGGKAEMAGAVLERAGLGMVNDVFLPLRAPGAPRARIQAMIDALDAFYDGGAAACLLALFSIGEAQALFQEPIRAGTEGWIASLAVAVGDAGIPPDEARQRAEDAVVRIQGALIIARASQSKAPFQRVLARLADDLLTAPSTTTPAAPAVPQSGPPP